MGLATNVDGNKGRLGLWAAGLAVLLAWPLGCGKRSSDHKTGAAGRPKAGPTQGAFGASWPAAAKGWVVSAKAGARYGVDGTPRRYDSKTVFELLDGGADAYLEAGLRSLWHARYRDAAGAFEDYEVLVFDLGSARRARALLDKEKGAAVHRVDIGGAGWAERGMVLFARGRHLVKVSAMPVGKKKPAPVEAVARRVAATPGARW